MKRTRLTLSAALREVGPTAVIEEIVAASPGTSTYTHPATHPPSIIAQDASNRFVTDTEKEGWNNASNFSQTAFSGLSKITVEGTAPVSPATGDLWIDNS